MKKIIVLLLAIIISGCNATSNVRTEKPLVKSLKGYVSTTINITGDINTMRNPDFGTVKTNLENAIATKIVPRTGLSYRPNDSAADLSINIKVNRLVYTSQGARIMLGIISGAAVLYTGIELIDTKLNTVLWKAKSHAHSKASHGVFAGSTTRQIEDLSVKIVSQLKSKI